MADSKSPLSVGFGGSPGLGIWHPSQWRPTLDNSSVPPAVIDAYSTEVLIDTPDIYYRMDETSGSTAYDSSGNGRHGTYIGGVTLGEAAAITTGGFSARFGPSGLQQIQRKHEDILNYSDGPMAYEFWAKQATAATSGYVFGKGTGTGQGFFASSDSKLHFEKANTQSTGQESGTSDANWHHWVISQSNAGNDVVIYKDGVNVTTVNNTSLFVDSALPFEVGGCLGQTQFNGWLDEFALYHHTLSGARVTAHYNAGIAASVTVTPPTLALAITTFQPSIPLDVPAASLATTTFAPAIVSVLSVPLATLVTATFAPSIVSGLTVPLATLVTAGKLPSLPLIYPPLATLATSTFAPSVILSTILDVPKATLVLTTLLPGVGPVYPGLATLTTAGQVPSLPLIYPPLATLTTTTFAPSIVLAQRLDVPLATLVTATFAPTLKATLAVPLAALTTATFAPGLIFGLTVPVSNLVTSTKVPFLVSTLSVPAASLVLSTKQPQAVQSVPVTALILTTFAPGIQIFNASSVIVPLASLVLSTSAPSITILDPANRLALSILRGELFPRHYKQRDPSVL